MKKSVLGVMAAAILLGGCSGNYIEVGTNASAKAKMRACMMDEANAKFRAGTLFAQGISETADELVNTCLKKLALQAAGISEESQSTAETIISNLKNPGTASN